MSTEAWIEPERMPLAGLVLNRVHISSVAGLSAERAMTAAEDLEDDDEHPVVAGMLRVHADLMRRGTRERELAARFTRAHPSVPQAQIPAQARDVHDLDDLRVVGETLADSA